MAKLTDDELLQLSAGAQALWREKLGGVADLAETLAWMLTVVRQVPDLVAEVQEARRRLAELPARPEW